MLWSFSTLHRRQTAPFTQTQIQQTSDRAAFYSAQEQSPPAKPKQPKAKRVTAAQLAVQVSALADLLPKLTQQVQGLSERQGAAQAMLPETCLTARSSRSCQPLSPPPRSPVSPPRVKEAPDAAVFAGLCQACRFAEASGSQGQDALTALASSDLLIQQSQALAAICTHLSNQNEMDMGGQGSSLSTKREKLQSELASRTSTFFLQTLQNAGKRVSPAAPAPKTIQEASQHGLLPGKVGRILPEPRSRDDHVLPSPHGEGGPGRGPRALCPDHVCFGARRPGQFKVGSRIPQTLLEDPAPQLFATRPEGANPRLRAFAPLVPAPLATTTLAFVKEVDLLNSRRQDAVRPKWSSEKEKTRHQRKRGPALEKGRGLFEATSAWVWGCPSNQTSKGTCPRPYVTYSCTTRSTGQDLFCQAPRSGEGELPLLGGCSFAYQDPLCGLPEIYSSSATGWTSSPGLSTFYSADSPRRGV